MGTGLSSTMDDAAPGTKRSEGRRGPHVPQHAAPPNRRAAAARGGTHEPRAFARAAETLFTYLPRGNILDEESFNRRHLFLCWVLALHVPALFALGAWRGFDLWHVALELVVPVACVMFARLSISRRLAAFFVTAGLVYCSIVLVHLSGGMIESHFHFFILIGLVALYQDWVPFLWNVVFTVLSHGLGTVIGSEIVFNHSAGQARPWTWAGIHGIAVLAACVGVIIFWKHTEQEQQRNVQLVAELGAAEAERRQAMSELLVNLARRNQSLLNRQLEVITDLELREQEPDVLEELFRLDHLATRIRRNAESLLVLSGDEPARRWGTPVPLGDVVRAAAAEVEEYRRVEVLVNDHIEVAGKAVADVAHLLAELIENATTFSPPSTQVRVHSQLSHGDPGTTVISIEDEGLGMPDDELRAANTLLEEVPEVDLGRSTMLGFHVVARLAQRYGLAVRLAATPGGGVTAMVALPQDLVSERRSATPATVGASTAGRGAHAPVPAHDSSRPVAAATGRLARLNGQVPLGQRLPPGALGHGAPGWTAEPPLLEPFRPLPAPIPALAPAPTPLPAPAPLPLPTPPGDGEPIEPPDWWWESEAFVTRPDSTAPARPPAAPAGGPAPGWDRQAETTSVWPLPPPPAPVAPANDLMSADPVLPPLADGLVRRVPGAHLAPSLRRDGATGGAAGPPPERDREHVRAMLSRFQASQRAGRAAAGAPPADPPQSPAGPLRE